MSLFKRPAGLILPVLWIMKTALTSITFISIVADRVSGHGYMKSPRSRNYKAYEDGVYWGGTEIDPTPERYVPGTTTVTSRVSCLMAISVIEYCTTFCLLYPFLCFVTTYFLMCERPSSQTSNTHCTLPFYYFALKHLSCPHCLNRAGPLARCGIVGNNDYAKPRNYNGGPLQWSTESVYTPGSIIDIDSVITAYHKGHIEVKACPLAHLEEIPSQECFDSHPLEFISDELYGAPKDITYPGRAYLAPPEVTQTDTSGMYKRQYISHFYNLFLCAICMLNLIYC